MEGESKKDLDAEPSFSYEVRPDGNMIVVKGKDVDGLVGVAVAICQKLDGGHINVEKEKEYLLKGEESRPGGVWAVKVNVNKSEIWAQNRNGRGVKDYNDKMLEAVESVILSIC